MKSLKPKVQNIQSQIVEIASVKFTIESNVKLPPRVGRVSPLRPLWESMKVGDSVLLPDEKTAGNLYNVAAKSGGSVARRKAGTNGIRVWRVA